MADDKNAREKQADDEERRQREREMQEARDRADEPEPEPIDAESSEELGELDDELENRNYPTTADELVGAYGDREVETRSGSKTVAEVLGQVDDESYESPDEVRNRIRGLIHR